MKVYLEVKLRFRAAMRSEKKMPHISARRLKGSWSAFDLENCLRSRKRG
jgi:hypothetical protein